MRIRVPHQVIQVDAIAAQQFMDQREGEQPIGARADADPLVRDRAVAGAHRVDRDDLRAARLELAQAELDRVGVVVFGDAPQHQVLRVVPVGFAEFPERAAQRVQPAGGHVHRAEPAVRGVIDRAELLRPPAGERLRLVAAGEEGQLVGIARADRREPGRGDLHRFVPADFLELALAALADAQQRARQARRRVMLHQPGRALGAQHAAVHRVIGIALDVADPPFERPHPDAAAARAHVAGGGVDGVARGGDGLSWGSRMGRIVGEAVGRICFNPAHGPLRTHQRPPPPPQGRALSGDRRAVAG